MPTDCPAHRDEGHCRNAENFARTAIFSAAAGGIDGSTEQT